ncbi:surface protein PspC [Clostridium paraputrificum]|uniref:N-acetylmuramoyl-L-alanine amidase n=6 Tax=Clostridiaceae TaxID=31979 RepID=UPI000D8E940F|nr:N-acetylmuramoyl-L-alanine amidase [Clostridium paraputrificum]SQB86135.1 surface protein PspC [Clostridium paraputrificum]
MYKRNKKLACTIALTIIMSINTVYNSGIIVYASQNNNLSLEFAIEKNIRNINIISDTEITVQDAKKWAKNNGATETFVNLADLYWKYSKSNGNVNPALAYVQAAHETGFGRFGGVLDESYYNPCGMKNTNAGINDDTIKEAHKKFDSWEHGVLAHLDHLALYAGSNGYPKKNIEQSYVEDGLDNESTYDPRHFAYLAGSAKTALDLSGSWAAGNYGEKLIRFYNELIKVNEQSRRGWYHDDNYNWYYYNEDGELHKGWLILPAGKYYLGSDGVMKKGWYEESGKKYYFNEYGAAVVGQTIEIDGKEYKFDKDGVLIKSIITGWYHDDNYNWYYYNEDGELHKGWLILPEGKYYLGSDGVMKKGWYEESGKKYYFNEYGAAVVGQTIEIDGKEYKFDKDGVLIKSIITGWYHDDNYNWYYYNEDGELHKGWLILPEGKYYLGSDGVMKKGWYEESGKKYYFNEYGAAVVGQTIEIDGKEYKFDKDGVLIKSIITGWYHDDNYNWYYYNEDGELHKGWLILPEGKYYLGSDGVMKKGWYEESGKKYYFNEYGAAVVGQTIEIDGEQYTFDKNGVLQIRVGWFQDRDKWYYYDENGKLHKGWLTLLEDKFYFDENGEMQTYWKQIQGKWYYFGADGKQVKGWLKSNDIRYYFKEDGSAAVGWNNIDGYDYFFYEGCNMAQLEFVGNTYVGLNGVAKYPDKGDKYRIVIDPGHYNQGDKGTVKTHDGITYEEGVINMQVAEILKTKLEEQGYEVLLTRTANDYGLKDTLENRVVLANNNNADLFISIHQDSFTDPSANGMTIFYDTYRPNIDNIGVKVDASGNKYDESPSRAAKISKDFAINLTKSLPNSLNIRNRGAKYANWYVTRNTLMPSLLIECGFLSNPTEAKKISDKSHQSKMASLLVENINTLFRK